MPGGKVMGLIPNVRLLNGVRSVFLIENSVGGIQRFRLF